MDNFLRRSKSFVAYATRKSVRKRNIEHLDLFDAICAELDENCESGGVSVVKKVQEKLSGKGVLVGISKIGKSVRLLQVTSQWLKGNNKEKQRLLEDLSGGPERSQEYFDFVRSGIECLDKDGIRTLADLEKAEEAREVSVMDIVSGAEPKAVLADVLPVKPTGDREPKPCELGIDLTEEAHEAVDRLIEIISAVTDQNRSMRSDYVRYLDEIRSLENGNVVLGARLMAMEKRNQDLANELIASQKGKEEVERDYQVLLAKIFEAETLIVEQKVQIASLDEENKKLKKFFHDFSRLKAEFNGASGLSTTFEKAVPEKIPEEIIAEKPEPEFPQWAAFFKRKVVFNKVAEEYLDSLRKKDRSRIVGGISFYINNDPSSCPASNGKKIEGGPYDGCREIKTGKKYRVLLKEEADAIRVIRVFRKGQNVNNIKK